MEHILTPDKIYLVRNIRTLEKFVIKPKTAVAIQMPFYVYEIRDYNGKLYY